MTRYRRGTLGTGDRWAAAIASLAIGAGVGAVTFYVTRLFLAREAISDRDEPAPADEEVAGVLRP